MSGTASPIGKRSEGGGESSSKKTSPTTTQVTAETPTSTKTEVSPDRRRSSVSESNSRKQTPVRLSLALVVLTCLVAPASGYDLDLHSVFSSAVANYFPSLSTWGVMQKEPARTPYNSSCFQNETNFSTLADCISTEMNVRVKFLLLVTNLQIQSYKS